jgi:hypothetical protein
MERRLNKKIEQYLGEFKDSIRARAGELQITNNESGNKLLQFVYDYERLVLTKDDFVKRKRVKNVVSHFDRCCAKRATDEQCTRRKKEGEEYCGTHMKGTPHGKIEEDDNGEGVKKSEIVKEEVWGEEINGIVYYIDKKGNVYKAEDVVMNRKNARRIGGYKMEGGMIRLL